MHAVRVPNIIFDLFLSNETAYNNEYRYLYQRLFSYTYLEAILEIKN